MTLRVADLINELGKADRTRFEVTYGRAFLLQSGITPPSAFGDQTTLSSSFAGGAGPGGAFRDSLLHPVRRQGKGRYGGEYIGVGRSESNPVVFEDATVSKFHAFFLEQGDGTFALSDAGSKNGTLINGTPVPSYREGDALPVKSGDNIRFGEVSVTFITSAEAWTLLSRLRS